MKNKLRGELSMIKDDLHQQLRRQQIEHDYEKDRSEQLLITKDNEIDDLRG